MAANRGGRIPICLVTGFLGSGKTTFLRNVVSRTTGRIVYVVNEFSPHDIDGAILSAADPNVVAIPGGSIFCRCLAGEFLSQFSTIPDRFGSVDGIVIEASGMANPKVIADMLRETGLDSRYALARIVSIVDPGSFLRLRHTLPNIIAQIDASDTVLLNKVDLYDPALIDETAKALESINPGIELHRCTNAEVEIDPFSPLAGDQDLHGEYAQCRDPNFQAFTIWPSSKISIDDLRRHIVAAEDDLYRAKGYVASDGRTLHFDYTSSGFSFEEESPSREPAVVLIMRNDSGEPGRDLVQWLGSHR